ncbi:transcriptional regulator, TetR family [Pseudomonas fluorescens Q2-87]|uniref:Transcriptional regulator, TetR family n=1 Tax=Pseudomonas fluorescens (strain Q2-87) TaxID=1038922 RepID=J2MST7_PSEFQ|nr:TetR/AcrR family transcriptional regulator [Pseudomonas fluorescens]EJL04112.1 transcriptional regulator, TetR family [Pseudomonas fluorescens Q2-87]
MRKTRDEAAATRRRIIESSRSEFQRNGIDGSGLTGLMAASGLTQGGFYKHFKSKAHLVSETTASAVTDLADQLDELAREEEGALEAIVRAYLSPGHRDGDKGCPYAGLGSELARGDQHVRGVAVEGFEQMVNVLSRQITDAPAEIARERAILTMCAMMGALTIARIAKGEALSDEVLQAVSAQLMHGLQARGEGCDERYGPGQ